MENKQVKRTSVFQKIRTNLSLASANDRATFSFFYFLVVILTGIAVWSMIASPKLKQPVYWVPFVILNLVHLVLHWSIIGFQYKPSQYIVYIVGQGALVFAICGLSGMPYISYGLFMALIGEAMGMFSTTSRKTVAVLFYLVLSLLTYYVFMPETDLLGWLLPFVPMTLFVIIYVNLYLKQIGARMQAQKLSRELEQANRQLSDYAAQIEQLTLNAERQRIARELHDSLSAGLAGTILQLEAADTYLTAGNTERAQVIVNHTMERARSALADARRMIDQLRSGNRLGIDLYDYCQKEARRLRESVGINCTLEMDEDLEIPEELAEALYRIVGEGISNIERHSKAKNCQVRIKENKGQLLIEIEDDGVGFDPAVKVGEQGHYGLVGIKERARFAHGQAEIHSLAGKGSFLRIVIPIQPARLESKGAH